MSTGKAPRITLDDRFGAITDAIARLSQAIVKDDQANGIQAGLILIQCGLTSLAEIADAQTRMAALAELDLSHEIEQAIEMAAEQKAGDKLTERIKRSFIGDKG